MKNNLYKKLITLSIASGLLMPLLASAGLATPLDVEKIIKNVINLVIWPIFFGLSIVMFIYAGFKFLTAAGDSSAINDAKKALIWAMVGIAVAVIGFSITPIITTILSP